MTSKTAKFNEIVKDQDILSALDQMGFTEATQIQSLAIPAAINKKSLVVEAKTGSGKTLAFGIPMLARLNQEVESTDKQTPYGLVVTPTRELAVQIETVFCNLLPKIKPVTLIGGSSYDNQKKGMATDSRIIIGTPGRILDAVDRGDLDLRKVAVFALDEADEMFSVGFAEDVEAIINETPEESQGIFVSATISDHIIKLAEKFLVDPEHISAADHEEEPPKIKHVYAEVDEGVANKPLALCDFLDCWQPDSAIIFCNTKSETELVEKFMRRRGFNARRINSDLSQSQRNKVMEKIHNKEVRYLIATDIAARGIDISKLELVVNFSIHQQSESYVHRTGRTGRAGREGTALSLVSPHDFLGFQAIKELDIELNEVNLPSPEEVAKAQLKNLENNLPKEVTESDLAMAKSIIENKQADELEEILAKLAKYTLEHLVSEEAVSLDEELAKDQQKRNSYSSGNNQNNQNRKKNYRK